MGGVFPCKRVRLSHSAPVQRRGSTYALEQMERGLAFNGCGGGGGRRGGERRLYLEVEEGA